jgi:hypothetical protein
MTFHPRESLSGHTRPETGWGVLDYELHQQKAQTLGDLGAQVEQPLAALRALMLASTRRIRCSPGEYLRANTSFTWPLISSQWVVWCEC